MWKKFTFHIPITYLYEVIVDNTPPEIASEFIKYEFYRNDLKGFINMDLNEKTKSLE